MSQDIEPGTQKDGKTWIVLYSFKNSGKYYTNAGYWSEGTHMGEWCEEVDMMRERGELPGLVKGAVFDLFMIDAGFPQILDLRGIERVEEIQKELNNLNDRLSQYELGDRPTSPPAYLIRHQRQLEEKLRKAKSCVSS